VPEKDDTRANPIAGNPEEVAPGAAIYKDRCAHCHGPTGWATPSPKSAADGDLEWFLRQGDLRHGMPSWSSLPRGQRWQIVAYLRSLQQ